MKQCVTLMTVPEQAIRCLLDIPQQAVMWLPAGAYAVGEEVKRATSDFRVNLGEASFRRVTLVGTEKTYLVATDVVNRFFGQ